MPTRGNWFYDVTQTTARFIDLTRLSAAYFETRDIPARGSRRVAELVVDGQKIALDGQAANEVEEAVRALVTPPPLANGGKPPDEQTDA